MTGLRRGFLAVVPPAPVLDALEALVGRAVGADAGVRWLARPQWHVTLRYVGAVAAIDGLADEVRAAVAVACADAALGGAGAFADVDHASVVWIGMRDAAASLRALAASVERAAVAAGCPAEPRPFRPHLTLARLGTPGSVRATIAALGADAVGPRWTIDEAVLFESHTRPSGAVYEAVARFPLVGAGGR